MQFKHLTWTGVTDRIIKMKGKLDTGLDSQQRSPVNCVLLCLTIGGTVTF